MFTFSNILITEFCQSICTRIRFQVTVLKDKFIGFRLTNYLLFINHKWAHHTSKPCCHVHLPHIQMQTNQTKYASICSVSQPLTASLLSPSGWKHLQHTPAMSKWNKRCLLRYQTMQAWRQGAKLVRFEVLTTMVVNSSFLGYDAMWICIFQMFWRRCLLPSSGYLHGILYQKIGNFKYPLIFNLGIWLR